MRHRIVGSANHSGSLAPVLRGEGWGEGTCVELRNSPKCPLTLTPLTSPLSTGAREPELVDVGLTLPTEPCAAKFDSLSPRSGKELNSFYFSLGPLSAASTNGRRVIHV